MSVTSVEAFGSRSFTLGSQAVRELSWHLHGATDETDAKTALLAIAPSVYQGLALDSLNADPVGQNLWKGYARYVRLSSGNEYTFDTGGGTQKITQSLNTIASYAPSGLSAPDFKGAIGVTHDKVEGVDITVPAYQFTETHYFDDSAVDSTFRLALFNATGTTNNAAWRDYAEGECLFLGASGTKRGDEKWSVTYRFAASPNRTGLTVGDITGIDKKGWEYLWVRYSDYEDSASAQLVKRPVAAYVEQVYYASDFTDLGIGP